MEKQNKKPIKKITFNKYIFEEDDLLVTIKESIYPGVVFITITDPEDKKKYFSFPYNVEYSMFCISSVIRALKKNNLGDKKILYQENLKSGTATYSKSFTLDDSTEIEEDLLKFVDLYKNITSYNFKVDFARIALVCNSFERSKFKTDAIFGKKLDWSEY